MNRALPALLAVMITGCESGNSVVIDVSVVPALASSFTSSSPAVLRVSATLGAQSVVPLCGSVPGTQKVVQDLGFGCLSDVGRTQERLRAWIQPLPDGWDKTAFCALTPKYGELDVSSAAPAAADGGVADALPAEPDPAWTQAETTVDWGRDGSPCGGIARGTLSLQ